MEPDYTGHTPGPLTYEREYSGENWLVAFVDFGPDENQQPQHWHITTDHVSASEDVMGDPEADVRLWSAAPALLRALQEACYRMAFDADTLGRERTRELAMARAAIARATGEEETD